VISIYTIGLLFTLLTNYNVMGKTMFFSSPGYFCFQTKDEARTESAKYLSESIKRSKWEYQGQIMMNDCNTSEWKNPVTGEIKYIIGYGAPDNVIYVGK